MRPDLSSDAAPIPSGVPGMDDILSGGYACNRAHLIEGRPGCGKTTLGLQFLLDGVRQGECCLYITLSESKRELTVRCGATWLVSRRGRDLRTRSA